MYKHTEIEKKLINKIVELLSEFKDFEKPFIDNNGNIIIKKRFSKRKGKDTAILTHIFKEIIKNDVKKNRV